MRRPKKPPVVEELLAQLLDDDEPSRLIAILDAAAGPLASGKYLHWDKLRYYPCPADLSLKQWWLGLKIRRRSLYQTVPLNDRSGRPFQFLLAEPIPERLHEIDLGVGGLIQMPEPIVNPATRDAYCVQSLIEEAITSSQLEGAVTTRRVAKEMIRSNRKPRDRSEQMILNNYRTMKRIGEVKHEPLTKELVFEIHRLVTERTLDDPSGAGRFRRSDEPVYVTDAYNTIFHDPPVSEQLEERMAAMCDFANDKTPEGFVHPAIRSIILHFWLAYDHPFLDGNGRTARALFYWSMLNHGFWLCEFISISQIILKAPARYVRAYLYTETDENDLTYFILYKLEIIRRAIGQLHDFIKRKTRQLQTIEADLRGLVFLNHRQRSLMSHALRHPHERYTIRSHRLSHNVVPQTARTDLLDLDKRGLLKGRKVGREWHFTPVADLEQKLTELS